jgi:hypothetical protein
MRYAPGQNTRSRSRVLQGVQERCDNGGASEGKQMRCFMMQGGHVALADILPESLFRQGGDCLGGMDACMAATSGLRRLLERHGGLTRS